MGKSYKQYCALAKTFEIVGERWTPLIIRELMFGGRRFADLIEGLPGIGASVLASRLKDLESRELVYKAHLPPPAASSIYQLTERGASLGEKLLCLAEWGMELLGGKADDEVFQNRWILVHIKTAMDRELAEALSETYILKVDEDIYRIKVDHGELEAAQLIEIEKADAVITATAAVLLALHDNQLSFDDVVEQGVYKVEGELAAGRRFYELFIKAKRPTSTEVAA